MYWYYMTKLKIKNLNLVKIKFTLRSILVAVQRLGVTF